MFLKDKISVIIPAFNEKENLEKLVPLLKDLYPEILIYIVDDNSGDGTREFLEDISGKLKGITLIGRKGKFGRGSAVVDGMKIALEDAGTDYFLEMDADFSHDPNEIKLLLNNKKKDTLVIGSRYVKGSRIINWPRVRRLLSYLANVYIRMILKIPLHDFTNGFRLYPKNAAEIIVKSNPSVKGYSTLSETAFILYLHHFKFIEVPTTFVNRTLGKSKISVKEYLQSLVSIIKIRKNYAKVPVI